MPVTTRAQALRLIQGWMRDDNQSHSAVIARQLTSGEWLEPEWLHQGELLNINSRALLSYVMGVLRLAGHHVQRRGVAGHPNARAYRVTGLRPAEPVVAQALEVLPPAPALSHYPPLGHSLQVKALALIGDDVVLHLSDGNGGAWQAVISGYVQADDPA